MSANHSFAQPPNTTSFEPFASYSITVSARGVGASPEISGYDHLLLPVSSTTISLR